MKSFKHYNNSKLWQTTDASVTVQRIHMKHMHMMAMKMAEASNDQIQYHNSREQLARLKNVPDGSIPMLDREIRITGKTNEAKASTTNSAADGGIAGIAGSVNDFAIPLFIRKGMDPRVKMIQRWDTDSKEVKELIKDAPKLKDHLRIVKGVGSKIQTQLASEWNETMASTMVWMEGYHPELPDYPHPDPQLPRGKEWPYYPDKPFHIDPTEIPLPYNPFGDDDGDGIPNNKDPNPNDPDNPEWENPMNPFIKPYNPFTDPEFDPVEPFNPSTPFKPIHTTPYTPITPYLLARGAGDKERETAASTNIKKMKKIINDSKKIQIPDDMSDRNKVSIFIEQTTTNINKISAILLPPTGQGGGK